MTFESGYLWQVRNKQKLVDVPQKRLKPVEPKRIEMEAVIESCSSRWNYLWRRISSQKSCFDRLSNPNSTNKWRTSQQRNNVQVESGAFTHFECGDAVCFPLRNWRILHTQMKDRCWWSITVSFLADHFSTVLQNEMQIWWTNFGVWPATSHWLLPGKYNIPWAIRLHRTSPKHDQGSPKGGFSCQA